MNLIDHITYIIPRIITHIIAKYDISIEEDLEEDLEIKIYDVMHIEIDMYVSNNSIEENKDIIKVKYEDIFDAIKSYEETYGNIFDYDKLNKHEFYSILAYHTLYEKIQENHLDDCKERIKEEL